MCFSPDGSQQKQYKKTLLWSKNMDQLQQYKVEPLHNENIG